MSSNPADAMPFSRSIGVVITEASAEAVKGELLVRDDLCTTQNIMHGGAIMAFADALGAVGAYLSLPDGAKGTTTIESKTNFLGAAEEGAKVHGVATPLKSGSRVSVWRTEISTDDGNPIAFVVQTQLAL